MKTIIRLWRLFKFDRAWMTLFNAWFYVHERGDNNEATDLLWSLVRDMEDRRRQL